MNEHHFKFRDRVRVKEGSQHERFRGTTGRVMGYRTGWDEDRAIVELDCLAGDIAPERIFRQDDLEVES
ncbi:hypothetical protein [Saccharopolyspora sp. NPDC002376]